MRCIVLWIIPFVVFSGGAARAEDAPWKVGLARAAITPERPLWLAGYAARTAPADGALHDLWIKVLALEDGQGRRGVVLTSDLLGFTRPMYDRLAGELERRYGLSRAQFMLTASHTHSGPVVEAALYDIYPLDDQQRAWIVEYSHQLEQKVIATVGEALGRLEPATLWAGEGEAHFAANRRMNREADVPQLRAEGKPLAGPADHRVPVLAVRAPDGALRAALFGYACHCTTLAGQQWSGDYAGFAQIDLEQNHPGAAAMFFAGCGADQNPMPRRTVEHCRQHGAELAAAVERVLAGPMRPLPGELATGFTFVELDLVGQPAEADLAALSARQDYTGRWAARLLGELRAGKAFPTSYRYPVQVWRLGPEQRWIALGGEVVVDYALRFQEKYGKTCWVAGYANDVMAYIPSRRIREEGGYEAGAFEVYGLPARAWGEDTEDRILAAEARLP